MQVAAEHPRGIAGRLPARELELVASQDHRRPPELGDPDLERDPRPRRRPLEQQGDRAAGERTRGIVAAASGLELDRPLEHGAELGRIELLAGEEVPGGAACQAGHDRSLRALTWNLFHGRDFPPDPALRTLRSRLTGRPERNATHLQVNRELFDEFATILAGAEWDIALLQECPPRWAAPLAAACRATGHRVLTARNWLLPVTSALAARNPDLIASWEGGSNLTLVRGRPILERRSLVLRRRPERRAMAFTRLEGGLGVANLHASEREPLAESDVRAAAERAVEWIGDSPLVFGGDLNLRVSRTALFAELSSNHGLRGASGPDAIDHLLARGLEIETAPIRWAPEAREVEVDGLAVRLSDHAPVAARYREADPG